MLPSAKPPPRALIYRIYTTIPRDDRETNPPSHFPFLGRSQLFARPHSVLGSVDLRASPVAAFAAVNREKFCEQAVSCNRGRAPGSEYSSPSAPPSHRLLFFFFFFSSYRFFYRLSRSLLSRWSVSLSSTAGPSWRSFCLAVLPRWFCSELLFPVVPFASANRRSRISMMRR